MLPLVIVIFILYAWFCIQVLLNLRYKLPLAANFLLFMAVEVILTNKLTISGYNLKLFEINKDIPHFIALILDNDFTVTFILLAFANVFLTSPKTSIRIGITVYAFLLQLLLGMELSWNHVLIYKNWSYLNESLMILLVMAYTLLWGKIFQRMASKEGWIR
ncbi:hypothetical protein SAMN05216378_4482 [Paenibacillus catalpae]|uniref:Uncharacterized protein n=1 Tax=Paenibacillus catalpae TaxID=1045775 RepID=A0A1I2E8U0_9BACL|nr:hypothetical protein [Paenibacillus catalpae]SFE89255.1 hypothetical protein SAMN05216378_4482 [Paenibacillus catalpae]